MSSTRTLKPESPTILEFTGPDAVRFLNGQLTQNLAGLGSESRMSCITNAKGGLEHLVTVCVGDSPDSIWVVSSHDEAEPLQQRLERYLIADDVKIADRSGQWTRIHADGPLEGAKFGREAPNVFGSGVDYWWPQGTAPNLKPVDPEDFENLRIEAGIPAWGIDLSPGILPPEAGLDRYAISYQKGCYIGQEVLSRIKSVGRVNRRLAVLELTGDVEVGDDVLQEGAPVGSLSSVAPNRRFGLAWIKKAGFDSSSYTLANARAEWLRWA